MTGKNRPVHAGLTGWEKHIKLSWKKHFSWGRRTILCVFLNRSALQGPVDFTWSALQELQGVLEKF